MTGFKNFLLRGNLIELAVAFIMATAFKTVVDSFTGMLTAFISKIFGATTVGEYKIADVDVAPFVNAVIAFVIMAAVVYFLVVVPYTKAKEKFFPEEVAGPSELELLTQIRDSLATRA